MLCNFEILNIEDFKKFTFEDISRFGNLLPEKQDKFSFLPKLFQAIKDKNTDLDVTQLLLIYSRLLKEINISAKNIRNQGSYTGAIPLFGLSVNENFLDLVKHITNLDVQDTRSFFSLETRDGRTNLVLTQELLSELNKIKTSKENTSSNLPQQIFASREDNASSLSLRVNPAH